MSISRRLGLVCALAALLTLLSGCDRGPSDEELLERFVEDVTGKVDEALLDRAVAYLQLSELPVDVRVPHMSGVFDAAREDELVRTFRRVMLQRFAGSEIRVRSQKIEIDGSNADIRLGLAMQYGTARADLSLRKLSTGWKVSRVHIDR